MLWTQKKPSNTQNPNLDFSNLRAEFRNQPGDTEKLQLAQNYLKIAKKKKDTIGIANLYFFLSKFRPSQKNPYADSIILFTKNNPSLRHPASGYLTKGNLEYELGNYKEALDFYLPALKSAKENNNESLYLTLKFNIGLLKNNIGERLEAQKIFEEYVDFLEKKPKFRTISNYNNGLFALTDSYVLNKELDSAKIYLSKGIKETLKAKDTLTYSYFVITSGIYNFFKENYPKAIDSLEKGKKLMLLNPEITSTRIATANYYLGSCYKALGKEEKSVFYFKNTDSILSESEDVIPILLEAYNHLIEHYKTKEDIEQQIVYINKLLRIDSIKHINELYLTKNISTKYDTFELISDKEMLIDKLKKDKSINKSTIIGLIIISVILFAFIIYFFRRSMLNKKRFIKLIEDQKNKDLAVNKPSKTNSKETIDNIPAEVVQDILVKLEKFETSEMFAKKHYTQNSLAKDLNTNSTYLSKVINVHKHMNFANYLNNLRVDYAVKELTSNKSLRSYTIQAIAEEVGFKNAQSFSSAFHRKTGIYPSYFIKNIKN